MSSAAADREQGSRARSPSPDSAEESDSELPTFRNNTLENYGSGILGHIDTTGPNQRYINTRVKDNAIGVFGNTSLRVLELLVKSQMTMQAQSASSQKPPRRRNTEASEFTSSSGEEIPKLKNRVPSLPVDMAANSPPAERRALEPQYLIVNTGPQFIAGAPSRIPVSRITSNSSHQENEKEIAKSRHKKDRMNREGPI